MSDEPILGYDPERRCPKCQGAAEVGHYREHKDYARDFDGILHAIERYDQERQPHLVIRCYGCGWEWLSETADANGEPSPLRMASSGGQRRERKRI